MGRVGVLARRGASGLWASIPGSVGHARWPHSTV